MALISDIHANLQALEAVLDDIAATGADTLACLGDVVGYGADPSACLELVRASGPVAVVQGNHDSYVARDGEVLGFNPVAAAATLWTREQLTAEQRRWLATLPLQAEIGQDISLVHDTLQAPGSWSYVRFLQDGRQALASQNVRFCFYGHTHAPMAFRRLDGEVEQFTNGTYDTGDGDAWLVNVGSVGQPRDGNWRAAWTLLDTDAGRLELRRVEYDLETCMERIYAAGLPARLAERLAKGR